MLKSLRKIQLMNCADWNASQAVAAYIADDLNAYTRLILQADKLWRQAAAIH